MKCTSFNILRQVQLHETDLGGLMHHHNYFLWMEQAEYEMFDHIEEDVVGALDENFKGRRWPRSKVSMEYLKPLCFKDKVEVRLKITRIRAATIEYEVDFYKLSEHAEEIVAKGKYQTISCLYDARQKEGPMIVPASDELLEKIEVFGN